MTNYETIRAYRRENDGTLTVINILRDESTGCPCDGAGIELTETDETETLMGWHDACVRVYKTDGGVEVLVPEEPTEYVWVTDDCTWGTDTEIAEEQREAACERAEEWLTEHEGACHSIKVREARSGEAAGIYERRPGGGLQILGHSLDVPEQVHHLTNRAWEHACQTWPED